MEANRNYEKALKILDYDPKTKTIKYDKPTDVENNYTPSRIHVFFDSVMTDKHGDYSTTAGRYREKLLTSINDLNKKENLSESDKHYLNKYKAELNELNKMKLSDDKPTIHLKRNTLNQRNLTGLVKALHEVGHNHVWDSREWDNSKSDRAKAEKYIDKNVKPYSDETDVNYNHKTRADEYLSDLYATRKTSPDAIKQMRSKDVKVYYDIFKKKINEESKNVNRLMKAINGTKDDTLKKQYTEEMNKSLDKINYYKKQIKSGEFEMDKLSNFASTNVQESCLIMESQANRNKVLERLDYDPKTQTIDTGIKKKNGEPIRIRIEIIHGKENGKFMPDDEDENVDEFIQYSYIKINKKILNMNNNAPMGVIYHEIGHFADMLVKKYSEDIDVSTVNLVKKINKYADKNAEKIADSGIKLNEHDGNKVEVVADTYSTNKTSKHTHDQHIKKLYNNSINDYYSQYKRYKKILDNAEKKGLINRGQLKQGRDILSDISNEMDKLQTQILQEKQDTNIFDSQKKIESLENKLNDICKLYNNADLMSLYKDGLIREKNGKKFRTDSVRDFKESCLIMDNHEFFMEASKNPDIKARKRTVKNLRKLGVDRAHEVDSKKLEELERQRKNLIRKHNNHEISDQEFKTKLDSLMDRMRKSRDLYRGINIDFTDTYGDKHNFRLTSKDFISDSHNPLDNTVNITPETMNSTHYESSLNHEIGHVEQQKRGIKQSGKYARDYNISDTDDYPIKCTKLFLQKNKDKMCDHDSLWTELHADFLSCKKIGFGKMIKDIYSFKQSKKEVEDSIDKLCKNSEEECEKLKNKYLKYTDEEGNEHIASQKDVDECVALYNESESKFNHYLDTLKKRYDVLYKKIHSDDALRKLGGTYIDKGKDILDSITKRQNKMHDEKDELAERIKHNGLLAKDAKEYKKSLESHFFWYNMKLKEFKAAFTTYDYRIKFLEDMKYIHDGHPGRCSMKYPPMTPADKKYMQEFTVEEMYLSNIITESEYLQLQERIQILTERSE